MSEEIGNMIDAIAAKDYNSAGDTFADLLNQKIQASLDDQKVAVANKIFNGVEDQLELDFDDDELMFDDDEEAIDDVTEVEAEVEPEDEEVDED